MGYDWGWGPGGATFTPVNQPPTVQRVMVPQSATDREAAAQAEKQRKAANAAKGAASTILTGGLGVQEEAPVKRKKLFGE